MRGGCSFRIIFPFFRVSSVPIRGSTGGKLQCVYVEYVKFIVFQYIIIVSHKISGGGIQLEFVNLATSGTSTSFRIPTSAFPISSCPSRVEPSLAKEDAGAHFPINLHYPATNHN